MGRCQDIDVPVITCTNFFTMVLLHISGVCHNRPTLSSSSLYTTPYSLKLRYVCSELPEKTRENESLTEEPLWLTEEVALSVV